MKKVYIFIGVFLLIAVTSYLTKPIPEPEHCSICTDISRHELCIINVNTGEKVELDIYEPHPFLVGELADEQPGGSFSLIRDAGVEGYRIGGDRIVVSIPAKFQKADQRFFCSSCREQLGRTANRGYILLDLKTPKNPVMYSISNATSFSVRCYTVSTQKDFEHQAYEITIVGHFEK